ncbi:YybH family protein [Streptomyces sp. NPDC051555]|uniref:YybH family protein n=1 Tax=Streptomyces sp. NPDC051555 TaxID=3365657 RepID=UPI0037AC8650
MTTRSSSSPSSGPTGRATTPITDPQVIGRSFNERCNAGDLDGLLALYEPDAVMVDETGRPHRGTTELRSFFTAMLSVEPTVRTVAATVVVHEDVAQGSTHWQLDVTAPDGTVSRTEGHAAELLRRQPDGTWLVAIDNPWGARRARQDAHPDTAGSR